MQVCCTGTRIPSAMHPPTSLLPACALQAVLVWLEADVPSRAASLPALLPAIRMRPGELLRRARDCGVLPSAAPQAAPAVAEALEASAATEEPAGGREAANGGPQAARRGAAAANGAARLPPPRQSMPRGLLAAGGHDVGWHSQKCACDLCTACMATSL